MTDQLASPPSEVADPQLAELVERLTRLVQSKDASAIGSFLKEHGEYAERLSALLPTLEVLAVFEGESKADDESELRGTEGLISRLGALGDFRLIREIGRGGMGLVYEAEQISLRRRVALKMLPLIGALDERARARFQNEAQAAASLHHPHIVPIFGVGCERGVHYYAMQFIEGQPLDRVIAELAEGSSSSRAGTSREERTIDSKFRAAETKPIAGLSTRAGDEEGLFRSIAGLGIQACEALDYAHELGVIHRDIKPGNLLLDQSGDLWIVDFGLARMEGQTSLTMTGDTIGTLRYMSPEQASGGKRVVDHRTDIYSLGATLYELLALRPLIEGHHREAIWRRILHEEPRPLRAVRQSVPRDLAAIVMKAVSKEASERYATAEAFAADLRRYVEGQSISARAPSVFSQVAKWSRRRRRAIAAGLTALAVCGAMGAAGAGWWAREQTYQREQLKKLREETANANRTLGIMLNDSGRAKEAVEAMRRPVDLQPEQANHRYALGRTLHQHGELKEAIAEYRQAVSLDPNLFRAHNNLGCALLVVGEYPAAVRALEAAIAAKADYEKPYGGLGVYYKLLGQYDRAVDHFHEAIRRQGDDLYSHYFLARCLTMQGKFAEAHAENLLVQEFVANRPEWKATITRGADEPRTPHPIELNEWTVTITKRHLEIAGKFMVLAERLPKILEGAESPVSAVEAADFAALCFWKGRYEEAVRFYALAFANDPTLEREGFETSNVYQAACAATKGMEAPALKSGRDDARGKLLRQARLWLRRDLEQLTAQSRLDDVEARRMAKRALLRYQQDPMLTAARKVAANDQLDETEIEAWNQIWADAGSLAATMEVYSTLGERTEVRTSAK